ncbi:MULTISPECIES: hypothetical protein [Lactobacillus]|uniref:hypothetical protein n=1 Tax=Lactobacillus TaxID=1578 RepID=UPI000CD89E9B|nr:MULTISPECIES: hypothetical protein [Lactobacillus]
MKRIKIFVAFFVAFVALGMLNTNKVQAAYGRGKIVTTDKSLRGTWYSKDYGHGLKKIKITAHTITLPYLGKNLPHGKYTLYKQSSSIFKKGYKYQMKASKYAEKHHWMSTWTYKREGKKYLGIDPFWLDHGDNDFGGDLRVTTVKKHGKSVKQLTLQNPNARYRYYRSISIAK